MYSFLSMALKICKKNIRWAYFNDFGISKKIAFFDTLYLFRWKKNVLGYSMHFLKIVNAYAQKRDIFRHLPKI